MRKLSALLLVLLTAPAAAAGWEHPSCSQPPPGTEAASAAELRAIAETCRHPALARLHYNRAYHRYLVDEARVLSRLIAHAPDSAGTEFLAYRLYIALVEQMAPHWFDDPVRRAHFLNGEYQRRGEIAELRLRGRDNLADRLEQQVRLPGQPPRRLGP